MIFRGLFFQVCGNVVTLHLRFYQITEFHAIMTFLQNPFSRAAIPCAHVPARFANSSQWHVPVPLRTIRGRPVHVDGDDPVILL